MYVYSHVYVYIKISLGKDLLGLLQPWYNFAKGDDQIVSGKISAAISYNSRKIDALWDWEPSLAHNNKQTTNELN